MPSANASPPAPKSSAPATTTTPQTIDSLAIYDHQCAACGLRIKLPVVDASFIDAALPAPQVFGLASSSLPSPTIARSLIRHRSTGEAELANLADQPVLPPHDDAFRPDPAALQWRCERLSA